MTDSDFDDYDIYRHGKIYIIRSESTRLCYIGSTIETLERRLQRHEGYEKEKENGKYKDRKGITSLLVLIYKDYKIDLIEKFPCNNKQELLWRERFWIDLFKSDEIEKHFIVNCKRPIRSEEDLKQWKKEYYEKNKEKILEYKKEYHQQTYERSFSKSLNDLFKTEEEKQEKIDKEREYNINYLKTYRETNYDKLREVQKKHYEENREHFLEYAKEYREQNKEVIKQWKAEHYQRNKEHISEKSKEYYTQNQEHRKQKSKEYYEKNKEKLSEKVECECGSTFIKRNRLQHLQSKKHKDFINSL